MGMANVKKKKKSKLICIFQQANLSTTTNPRIVECNNKLSRKGERCENELYPFDTLRSMMMK